MELTKEQRILSGVIQKAWNDPAFKNELVNSSNARAFIENYAGEELDMPEHVQIKVNDQTDPNYGYLNLPARPPQNDDMELSDEQLETVAGGESAVLISIIISAATLSYLIGEDL